MVPEEGRGEEVRGISVGGRKKAKIHQEEKEKTGTQRYRASSLPAAGK